MSKKIFWVAVLWLAIPVGAEIGEIDVRSGPPPQAQAESDQSVIWIRIKPRATLLLIDPKGRRIGYDPKTETVLQEVPASECSVEFDANPYTGEEKWEVSQRMTIEPALPGVYKVMLTGLQDGPYEINFSAQLRTGSSAPSRKLGGLISRGQRKTFRLAFNTSADNLLSVVDQAP